MRMFDLIKNVWSTWEAYLSSKSDSTFDTYIMAERDATWQAFELLAKGKINTAKYQRLMLSISVGKSKL